MHLRVQTQHFSTKKILCIIMKYDRAAKTDHRYHARYDTGGLLLLFMIFQMVKIVYVGARDMYDYPSDPINEELEDMEIINAPRPGYWLRDSTILKEVDHVIFDPEEILGQKFYSRVGVPEAIGLTPTSDPSEELCPSRLIGEDAMEIIRGTLSFLDRFDMKSIIYDYPTIKPVDMNPHHIKCVCNHCIDTIEERFDLERPLVEAFKEALGGISSKTLDDIRSELINEAEAEEYSDIDAVVKRYTEEIEYLQEERREVYQKLKEEFFVNQSKLILDANRNILRAMTDITGASVKVIQPFMVGHQVERDDIVEFARISGFTKDLLEEFDVECIFGRMDDEGGEIIHEYPEEHRGLFIYSGETDDKYNLRIISNKIDSGEILVIPEDTDSLMEVLRSLYMWV